MMYKRERSRTMPDVDSIVPAIMSAAPQPATEIVTPMMSYEEAEKKLTLRDEVGIMFREMKGKGLQQLKADVSHLPLEHMIELRRLLNDLLSEAGY